MKPSPAVLEERARWFYRRVLTFGMVAALVLVLVGCVVILGIKSPDAWPVAVVAIGCIAGACVTGWLYIPHVHKGEQLASLVQGAAQGIAAAAQSQGPNYGLE